MCIRDSVDADSPSVDSPEIEPNEGLYLRADTSVEYDNCGLLNPESWGFAYTEEELFDSYLPGQAGLMPGDGFFMWREAEDDLETRGAVTCDYEESGFSCESQGMRVLSTYSLYSYYEIDIAGEILSEDTLETETTVDIVEVDTFTSAYLGALGIDLTECDLTVTMTWERTE